MISLKNIALLLFVVGVVTSCNCKKKTGGDSETKSNMMSNRVIVQSGYIAPESTDPFTVENALVKGDNLIMYVSYGGGCKTHEFKAYASDVYMKSMPPKLGLFIEHNANTDLCKSIVRDTLTFDLSTIKYPGKDKDYSVVFTLNNWKGSLEYKY
jgi:hypothetical protein